MPSLVMVSGTRVPLRRGQSYVLGRGRDCDIVIEDGACSRRHALITVGTEEEQGGFIEDLDSRNGVFHNGERLIMRTPIKHGSRIQIGGTIYLVHLKEKPEDVDFAETGTVGFEASGGFGEDLDGGELSNYGLVDLLKLLMFGRRDVTLHVARPDDQAKIELRGGEVVAARYAGLRGFNALVKLGRSDSGIFWVAENDTDVERELQQSGANLLIELARCLGASAPK